MSQQKIVIINEGLMRKIDGHRGELSRGEFVGRCVDSVLHELGQVEDTAVPTPKARKPEPEEVSCREGYVDRQEFDEFKSGMERLQQEFMDFFAKYHKELAGEKLSPENSERFCKELKRLLQL